MAHLACYEGNKIAIYGLIYFYSAKQYNFYTKFKISEVKILLIETN